MQCLDSIHFRAIIASNLILEHLEADKYLSLKSGIRLDIQSHSVHPSQHCCTSSKAYQGYSMYLNHTAPKIQRWLSIADDGKQQTISDVSQIRNIC